MSQGRNNQYLVFTEVWFQPLCRKIGNGHYIFRNTRYYNDIFRSEITTASSVATEIATQSDLTSCVSERTVLNQSEAEVIESSDHGEHDEEDEEPIPELINSQKSSRSYAGSQGQDRDFRSESNGPTSATSEDTMLSHDEKKRKVEDLSSAVTRLEESIDEGIRKLYSSKTDKEAVITGDDGDGKYEKYDKDAFQVRILNYT